MNAASFSEKDKTAEIRRFSLKQEDISAWLPPRPANAHKGTFGKVLVAGGCPGMAGAACFTGEAAYRCGCGLVKLLAPEENRIITQILLPEAVLALYDFAEPSEAALKAVLSDASVSALALGPGLGKSDTALLLLRLALETNKAPLVLDADGLNLLAEHPGLWQRLPAGTVITPHPGEMSRLTGLSAEEIRADIPGTAERVARERGVICVLKDAHTAVSDGRRTMINRSGNQGMATGGSGDVLTGIIASLLAQGLKPFEAASLGVFLHGLAGDAAAQKVSARAMIASDIIDGLPDVFRRIEYSC